MQRFDRAAQEAMEPGLQEIAAEARAYPLLDYLDAVARREQLIVAANRFHQTYDLLVMPRSEEHTSELQSLMRISYAVFCLKKNKQTINKYTAIHKIRHIFTQHT